MKIVRRVAVVAATGAAMGGILLMGSQAASASPAPPPAPGSYGQCNQTLTTNTGVLGGLEDVLYGGANNWQASCP